MTRAPGGWVLTSVEVAGFLGAGASRLRVELDRPLVILLGPNGSGKSTLLAAVEWALFGKTAVGADAEPLKGAGNDPFLAYLHRGCDEALVTLTFRRAGTEVAWSRRRSREKPRNDEVICEIDGSTSTADVEQVFGLSESVFRRAVAPAQAALRALVSADADARDLALDVLFGIERFRVLTKGLGAASRDLDRTAGRLQSRLDGLFDDLQREVARRFDRRADARARALAMGLAPADLTVAATADGAGGLAGELGVKLAGELAAAADLRAAADSLTAAADARWRSAGPVGRKRRLEDLVAALDRPREIWERSVAQLEKRRDELAGVIDEHGDDAVLERDRAAADEALAVATRALERASERAAVLHSARRWIAAHGASAADCPVCERPVVIAELTELVDERLRSLESADGTVVTLQAEIKAQSARVAELGATCARVDAARSAIDDATDQEARCRGGVLEAVAAVCEAALAAGADDDDISLMARARELAEDGARSPHLSDDLRDLSAAAGESLRAVGREIVAAQEASTTLRDRVQRLGVAVDFLQADRHLDDLNTGVAGPELASARRAAQETASWRATLSSVVEVAGTVSADEARRRTRAVTPQLSVWFERLSRHASLRSAAIDVETVRAGGGSRNSYRIRALSDDGWQAARGPALSGGYQTILAVAAMCALADDPDSDSGLSLLALDEPTQSLDPELTTQLGRALGEHLRVERLVVTTTDQAFAAAIEKAAGASRVRRVVFADWSAESGIVVSGGVA